MNVVEEHTEQMETNQEPSEKEDTETVDATDATNAGDEAKVEEEKPIENRRLTRTKAKVEENTAPVVPENRRLTRSKAKMAVEPQPQPQVEEKKR